MIAQISKLTLIAGISLGLVLRTTPASARTTITCESYRGRYNFCRVDTRGGVRLRRQISNAECRQGRSWGYDRDGIWVDNGCSAEFEVRARGNRDSDYRDRNSDGNNTAAIVGGVLAVGAIAAALASNNDYDSSSDDSFVCSSKDGGYTRCSTSIRPGERVYLKRQLSNAGCWAGNTWGYDREGIWVDGGCRGLFEIRR